MGADEGGWRAAFARYKKMGADQALRVPDNLEMRHAALVEPLAVALHGITRSGGADPGKRYLVTGGGPIGFLSVAALRARRQRHRGERAPRQADARCASGSAAARVTPDELEMPAMPHDLVDEPFDVVLECAATRRPSSRRSRSSSVPARSVLVGAGISKPKFDSNRILLNELMITGSVRLRLRRLPAALELLASGDLPLDLLVEPGRVSGSRSLLDTCVRR